MWRARVKYAPFSKPNPKPIPQTPKIQRYFVHTFWVQIWLLPCGATLCKSVFSGGIAGWEQRQTRKTIWLKISPKLLFYQFISKLFAARSTLCHLPMTQCSWPRGLANQKECTQALSLISPQTLYAFLHTLLVTPLSHHTLLYTHNPPLLICSPPFSHNHGVSKNTLFTPMALPLAQKLAKIKLTRSHGHQYT